MNRYTFVMFCGLLLIAACHVGPVSGAALGAVAALDQLLAAGTISPEQYQALRAGLGGFSMPEILGTVGGTAAVAVAGFFKAKNAAVAEVMRKRGPTAAERAAGMSKPG